MKPRILKHNYQKDKQKEESTMETVEILKVPAQLVQRPFPSHHLGNFTTELKNLNFT